MAVNKSDALVPPVLHGFFQRISRIQPVLHRHGIINRQQKPDAERPENVRHMGDVRQEAFTDQLLCRRGDVDVVEADDVDADRRKQSGVGAQGFIVTLEIVIGKKDGHARIPALYMPVHVVPVIDHAQRKPGRLHALGRRAALAPVLKQAVGAIEHPAFAAAHGAAVIQNFKGVAHCGIHRKLAALVQLLQLPARDLRRGLQGFGYLDVRKPALH